MTISHRDEADMKQTPCFSTADQQLAELQLLTRVDHSGSNYEPRRPPLVRGGSTLMLDIIEHSDEEYADDDAHQIPVEAASTSSFSALLAASRRLAGTNATTAESIPTISTASSQDSLQHAQSSQDSQLCPPTSTPTLCEEADDPATVDAPGMNGHLGQEMARLETCQQKKLCKSSSSPHAEREDLSPSDPTFVHMLEQISYDQSFLALSVTDLSPQNLVRVRDAIAHCSSVITPSQQGADEAKSPLPQMRTVRTLLSLDTLRLFLLRYDEEQVLCAVTNAIRRIYEQYLRDHNIRPLAHSQCVVTANNIARVVLLVRDTLKSCDAISATAMRIDRSLIDNNTAKQRASPGRIRRGSSSPTKSSIASSSSWHTCRSPTSSSRSSPSKGPMSPRAASAASPYSPGSSTSSSSLRRSVLASDGAHVLLNEKLAQYQHRGDVNRLPTFKVRRESDDSAEEAALRRQRSIQYGNEVTKALRG